MALGSDPLASWGCPSVRGGNGAVPNFPPRQTTWMRLFHHFSAALGRVGLTTPHPPSLPRTLQEFIPEPPFGCEGAGAAPGEPPAPWAGAAGSAKPRGPGAGLGAGGCGAGPAPAAFGPGAGRPSCQGPSAGASAAASLGCSYQLFGRRLCLRGSFIK